MPYFTKAQSNPQFPSNLPNQDYQFQNLGNTLDDVYNAYLKSRQISAQESAQSGAEKERRGMALLQYGLDPSQVTPEAYRSALLQAPQGPALPGQQTPAQQENPLFGLIRSHVEKKRAAESRGIEMGNAQMADETASARLKNVTADLYERGGGVPGKDGPEIVTKDGQQFIVKRGLKGEVSYTPNTGSQMQSEVGTKIVLAQDALENLDYIETALKSPKARELMIKAGGSFSRLKSLNDPEAESLANAIFQAGDAEARVKTGAAINNQEMENYFNNLVSPTGTIEGSMDRISRKKSFFNRSINVYGQGRNIPGGVAPKTKSKGTDPLGIL